MKKHTDTKLVNYENKEDDLVTNEFEIDFDDDTMRIMHTC